MGPVEFANAFRGRLEKIAKQEREVNTELFRDGQLAAGRRRSHKGQGPIIESVVH